MKVQETEQPTLNGLPVLFAVCGNPSNPGELRFVMPGGSARAALPAVLAYVETLREVAVRELLAENTRVTVAPPGLASALELQRRNGGG